MTRSFNDSTAERPESKFLLVRSKAEKGLACVVKGVMTGSADEGPDWPPHARASSKMQVIEELIQSANDLAAIPCLAAYAA